MGRQEEKKFEYSRSLFWIVLLTVLFVIHAFINIDFGDDLYYAGYLKEYSLREFLLFRYQNWTSRILIEAVLVLTASVNPWVWKSLNIFMSLLLIWNIGEIFGKNEEDVLRVQIFMSLFACFIPIGAWNGAGFEATTVNYLWPLSLGISALWPLSCFVREKKMSKWEYPFRSLCLLFAANMELMAAVLSGFYLLVGGYLQVKNKNRKLSGYYVVQVLLLVLSLAFVFTAPGNAKRSAVEMSRFFPEFAALTMGQKLWMGFLFNCHYFMGGTRCVVYLVLMIVMTFCCLCQGKKGKELAVFLLPVFVTTVTYLVHLALKADWKIPKPLQGLEIMVQNQTIPGFSDYSVGQIVLQTVVYLVVLGCTVAAVAVLHGRSEESLLEWLILAAGFGSRWVMGLSPTIFVSGERTGLFLCVAILIVAVRNLQLVIDMKSGKLIRGDEI